MLDIINHLHHIISTENYANRKNCTKHIQQKLKQIDYLLTKQIK